MKSKTLLGGMAVVGLLSIFGVVGAQTLNLNAQTAKSPEINLNATTTNKTTIQTPTATTTTTAPAVSQTTETTVMVGSATGGETTGTLIIATPANVVPPSVPTSFQDPRTAGTQQTGTIVVSAVEQTAVATSTVNTSGRAVTVRGKARPFAFVTIYLFSTPTVVIVQADANGNWQYTFSKDLPDGEHKVYAAVVDNKGAIAAKSQSVGFIKQAAALTVSGTLPDLTPATPSILSGPYMMALAILLGVLLAYALVFFGQKYWRPTEVVARDDQNSGGTPPMAG